MHARARIPHDRYAETVLRELEVRAPLFEGRRAVSVYFGGGTPGLWRADCVGRVLAALQNKFAGAPDIEVTLEANPDFLPDEQLEGFARAGVTRLSLGVESLQPRHLGALGRLHGADEPRTAAKAARAAGLKNLSLDLMFGMPGQTLADLDADLDGLLALEPDHLSIYNLTVEERTPFGAMARAGTLKLPDSGIQAEMYQRVMERMRAAGFEHYEISSWARPGRRAVHNSLYWTGGEFLGLGCSAHSHRLLPGGGGERFSTVRSVDDWFAKIPQAGGVALAEDPALAHHELLDANALEREAVWLGLRLLDGVSRTSHQKRHQVDPFVRHADEIARLAREGLAFVDGDRLRLTPRGVLFADEVGARFL